MAVLTLQQAFDLAGEYQRSGRLAEAQALYLQLLNLEPNNPDLFNMLGLVAHQRGALESATDWLQRAIAVHPTAPSFHNNLGNVLQDQGRLAEAIACYRRAVELGPQFAQPYNNLAAALTAHGSLEEAAAVGEQAIRLDPSMPEAYTNLAVALQGLGKLEDAIALYRRAADLPNHFPGLADNYLAALQYQPGITLRQLHAMHLIYEGRYVQRLRSTWQPHANSRDPGRVLRLGFISPHFHSHPVGRFIVRLFENLDRARFQIVCYADTARADAMTERLRAAVAEWNDVRLLSDEALASRVREDRIDILFDLAGHTPGNRLLVFARKPAPVQITWLDYVGTTGLSAIDYILADPREIPEGAEPWYSEKVLRLPDDYICFDPPAEAPPVGPLPAATNGFITFASFNIVSKTSGPTIALWSRILRRLPTARLIIKNKGFEGARLQADIRHRFAQESVDPARIEFRGPSPHAEFLASYQEADIALDTFPYNGGLTTCEALWMGLPVVSCAGETFAGRHGLAHLTAAGSPEWGAADFDAYVDLAVALASDLDRLSQIRSGLRARVAASPLCDGPRFAANFAGAMEAVWQHWCKQTRGQSEVVRNV